MRKVDVFTLTGNSDQTEGRGSTIELAHFTSPAEGRKVLNDPRFWREHGVQGCKMDEKYDSTTSTIKIYDTAAEYWAEKLVEKRDRALGKLTPEEIDLIRNMK